MLVKTLSRWLYPGWCAVCNAYLLLTEDHLCRKCHAKLNELRLPVCGGCGVELPPYAPGKLRCARCRKNRLMFDEIVSIYRYDEHFKELLHQVKFERKFWLLDLFRRKIDRLISGLWSGNERPTFIVPVPLDGARKRERSFNQSLLIAQMLSKALGIPVKNNVVARSGKRTPQSMLTRRERLASTEGTFRMKNSSAVKNSWVLVVDDVVTTGATAHECAKIIKEAGAARVSVFSLARTPSLI